MPQSTMQVPPGAHGIPERGSRSHRTPQFMDLFGTHGRGLDGVLPVYRVVFKLPRAPLACPGQPVWGQQSSMVGGSCILVKACAEAGPAEPGAEGRRESLLGGSLLCPDKQSAGQLPRGVEGSKRPRHLRGTSPMLRVQRVKGEGGPWRPASWEKHSTWRNPGDGSCSRAPHPPLRRGFLFEEIKGPGEVP